MTLPHTWSLIGDYYIPHRVILLARMIDREMARDLQQGFNLSVAEWRVLAFTCTVGSSSAAEICTAFEIDRAEVSRAVARLLKAGLVRREPDRQHRQKKRITPTEAGLEVFGRARINRDDYGNWILQDLAPDERAILKKALEAIARRVDERRRERNRGDEASLLPELVASETP